jgi:GTP:adenosylcobinamide-phosphate guanylyltransferase
MRPNDEFENTNEIEEDDENIPAIVREDKIFNNRYNTGDGLPNTEDYSLSRGISVSRDYSDSYLRDLYEYESELETKFILDAIFSFLQNDPEISEIITRSSLDPFKTKSKFSKEDVNFIFNKINTTLELKSSVIMFYSPIYILEVISSISSVEYKKLFDMLETEIQELLLTELNKKYQFLDGKMHKKKIH